MKRWSRFGREVWLIAATTVDEWPAVRPWASDAFALLIATDRAVDCSDLAPRALEQGLAAVAAWGPGCGEIETQFDLAIVGGGTEGVSLTTSHETESLDEALEFFLDVLFPATPCTTWVIFALGDVANRVARIVDDRADRFTR